MISLLIFYLHLVAAVYAFARGYFDHKLVDGFMSVAFFGIIFSVGWTIAGFIVRFMVPTGGLGPVLDADTISLLIVTVLEIVLYSVYFRSRRKAVA
jgi:hypothetical protein